MLSLIWLVFKGIRACAFTIVVYIAHVRTKNPKCIITFICRYASYSDSIDSLNKSNNIHIPPNGRKISTSRIKSVRLPNQHLIYIWYSLQSWAVKKYLPLTSTPQRRRLYRRRLESNSSWSIKASITKIASLAEVSSHIINYVFHFFNFWKKLLLFYLFFYLKMYFFLAKSSIFSGI